MDQVKNLWSKVILCIKLGKAVQEKLDASYSSKLTSESFYFCIE